LAENVDFVDLQIISLLQEDAMLSLNTIASKLGLSVGTTYNRIGYLKEIGVLKGYSVTIDPVKLGYDLTAITLIQARSGDLTEAENELAKTVNVIAVYDITGDFDAIVITKFKDVTELRAFLEHLSSTPQIKRAVTNIALNVTKEDFKIQL
jgi:DNA-binding Lrp family transcriptional regulator